MAPGGFSGPKAVLGHGQRGLRCDKRADEPGAAGAVADGAIGMPEFSSTFGGGGVVSGSIKVTIPPVPNVRQHLWAAVQKGSGMVLRTAKLNIRKNFAPQGRMYRGKWQTAEERLKARRKRRTRMRAVNRKALKQGLAEGRAQDDIEMPFSERRIQGLGV